MKTVLKFIGVIAVLIVLVVGGWLWWLWDQWGGHGYGWHQEVRLVVETPEGEVVGRSVQAVEATYYKQSMGNEVSYKLTGEAVVADLGEGRYLFALLGSGGWAEGVYRDLGYRPAVYRAIKRQKGEAPRVLTEKQYPRLVTFGDVSDPATVQAVEPCDLAATFGEGYALKEVTFGITREPVTEGEVEKVLGWWCDYRTRRARLNNSTSIAVSTNELSDVLGTGAFRIGNCH